MSSATIKIKLGSLELEYEGDPAFLKDGLPDLLERVSALSGQPVSPLDGSGVDDQLSAPPDMSSLGEKVMTLTSNSVAARLDVKTGSDLIVCALATLEIFGGRAGVSKKDIQHEMKQAKSYFSASHINNFGKNLANLVKAKRVNQSGADSYALSASERKQLEVKLADAE